MLTRRHLIAQTSASVFVANLFARAACARTEPTDFPSRPVRFVVPAAAGGPTDIVARMLAEKLSKMWGQQVFIENKGGAGTNLGNEFVARSDPDGYTVLFATSSLAVNASLYRSLSYDPIVDFAPVSLVTQLAYFVFVPNSSPAHSIWSLSTMPNPIRASSRWHRPAPAAHRFLAEMLFLQMAEIKMTHVPYRGASPAFTDLISGSGGLLFRQRHCFLLAVGPGSRSWRPPDRNETRQRRTCRPSPRPASRVTT